MKCTTIVLLGIVVLARAPVACADDQAIPASPTGASEFCVFAGLPPSDYTFIGIRPLKASKGTYGSITEEFHRLVEDARSYGADAVVNYSGSQRFGFWPWRVVHPVARGTAIKWTGPRPKSCSSIGGTDATAPPPTTPIQYQAQQRAAPSPPAPPAPLDAGGDDLQSKLQTLKQAYDQGLITKAEYDSKRKALLGDL